MKRGMLLALLAMALPTAALASGIDFSTGGFQSGSWGGDPTNGVTASVTGTNGIKVSIMTGTLTMISGGFSFNSGSVTVWSGNTELFTDSLVSGTINMSSPNGGVSSAIISGIIAPFTFNGTLIKTGTAGLSVTLSGNTVTDGIATASLATPEPSTLGLLGTGLIGLAAMVRRRLKAPTISPRS